MVQRDEVRTVVVEDLKGPLYMLPAQDIDVDLSNDVFILSPFDILNVFRHRLKSFFGFDYQIECFVPAAKRKYGYFSLPVLAGDTFIASMDAKADRKGRVFIVHNIHFEPIVLDEVTFEKFVECLKRFVQFNQCQNISFIRSNNKEYLDRIASGF
jgi:uncharacterized protein YcaQ